METVSPAWLDACYVQKILRNAEKDESIEVSDITVKAATAKGDNYGSEMYRVGMEASRVQDGHRIQEKNSLIVKATFEDDLRQEMLDATATFDTEASMMSVTLPKMTEILENVSPTSFSARCFHVQYEKPAHVVVEDLALRGFRMAQRQAGLDLDHCLLAIRNLGRFHAASVALKEKDPNAVTKYTKGLLHKDQHAAMIQFFNTGTKILAEEFVNRSELSPRIVEKLFKLSEVLFEKGCEAALYREDDFNVLNHGDLWINNMLFRYDEQQKPIDYVFVDFQFSHYGSPAVDILYFLGTSPTNEIRLHHREALLREYYASVTETMVKLKCKTKVPSFEKLQEILKSRAFCEVFSTLSVLPGVVLEKGEELDIEDFLKANGKYDYPMYRGKSYKKIMNTLLPVYDSMGLLDV